MMFLKNMEYLDLFEEVQLPKLPAKVYLLRL
jgi:hypothetical protein